ncbi:hypothetical protein [Bradyrhizobium sp.]|uniref:hypothetical protein n=1 Tax=Bradyrhizobium sp. TaxID=376 RepID=UPI0039E6236B
MGARLPDMPPSPFERDQKANWAPEPQDGERAAKEALENRFVQRTSAEIEHLIVRLLTSSPFTVKVTAFGFVHEVVLPRFRQILEEQIPHDASDHPSSARANVLAFLGQAADFIIQSNAEQFSLLSNGRVAIPSMSHLRESVANYLQAERHDAIIVGQYYNKFAPIEGNLEANRLHAEFLLEELAKLLRDSPTLAEVIRQSQSFNDVFSSAAAPMEQAPLLTRAPELWESRAEGSGETSLGFLRRVYGPWLADITIADLRKIDEPLYLTLKQWGGRNKVPQDLKAFFGEAKKRRSRQDVEAELAKYNIKKPADAFARFPNDQKRARRLYQAAKIRL